MKKSVLYIALACATIFLTQCRKPAVNPAEAAFTGEKISVTMTSQSGRASRTDIDNTGKITWTAGDQLLVVSPTLGVLGRLTLTSGAGASNGKFDGVINNWTATERLKLYYIGHYDGLAFPTEGATEYTLNVSAQNVADTPAAMVDNIAKKFDILMGETHEMAPGSTVFGAVTLQPMIAIANFDTQSSSGFTNAVECRNAWNSATLDLTTGSFTSPTTNAISLGQPNNDQFVALIPGTTTMTFHSEGVTDIVVNKTIEPGAAYSDEGDPIELEKPIPHLLSVEWDFWTYDMDYYTWEEAMALTFPDGWRLPTMDECLELFDQTWLDGDDPRYVMVTPKDWSQDFYLWCGGYNNGLDSPDMPFCWTSTPGSNDDEAYVLNVYYNHSYMIGVYCVDKNFTIPVHLVRPYSK